jgi:hypothetical protein
MAVDEQDCSECGSPVATTPTPAVVQPLPQAAQATGAPQKCTSCKKPLPDDATFCEFCGAERTAPVDATGAAVTVPSAHGQWIATLTVNAERWQKAFHNVAIPQPRDFWLQKERVTVGRPSTDFGYPDIDLGEDIAVSRRHAELIRQTDGTYSVCLFKTHYGSTLDGSPLEQGVAKPITDGSKFELGDLSTLTFAYK